MSGRKRRAEGQLVAKEDWKKAWERTVEMAPETVPVTWNTWTLDQHTLQTYGFVPFPSEARRAILNAFADKWTKKLDGAAPSDLPALFATWDEDLVKLRDDLGLGATAAARDGVLHELSERIKNM